MHTSQGLLVLASLLTLCDAQFTAGTAPALDPTSTAGGDVPTRATPVPLGGASTGTISAFGGSVATVGAASTTSSTGMSVAVTGGFTSTAPMSSHSEGGAGSVAGGATLMTATGSDSGSFSSTASGITGASSTRAGGSSASTAAGSTASAAASQKANAAPAYGVGWQVLQGVLVAGGAGVVVAQLM